jgi:hypothetical protein
MAENDSASIHQLHQPRPKTAAERAKAYRARKRAEKLPIVGNLPVPAIIPPEIGAVFETAPKEPPTVTFAPVSSRDAARVFPISGILLTLAALGLAGVGLCMNGYFARSLGATEPAGWLFLAVGVAADVVALSVPSVAARLWQARQRTTAATAWLVWFATFAFALMSGIGFASVNISDVTLQRSARVTPAVVTAQAALSDAMASRDRECRGGVGKFCRDREAAVVDLRKALDSAMASVQREADPQTTAAVHLVTWASRGALQPTGDDFGMLRLMLLALLPQIGGILMMIGRQA